MTTGVIEKKTNEVYKVEIHCPNLSPSILYLSRGERESFAVQSGDHFRSWDHLRFNLGIICGPIHYAHP